MPNHGDERNRRQETTYTTTEYRTANGPMALTHPSLVQTVSERWCSECGKWVQATGLIGGMMCQVCHTMWKGEN